MAKLNQIIAVEKGVKAKANTEFTSIYHRIQKTPLLSGISRVYQPKDDEGEKLPPESTKVQVDVEKQLEEAAETLTKLFDVTATKDFANQTASAPVVVEGVTLIDSAPVPFLLFLEKQLTDVYTFVSKLPVLDAAEDWVRDATADAWKTNTVKTTRTRKVPRNHVKAEATTQHPAQVEVFFEDQIVGTWNTVRFSGALPQTRVNAILERVEQLQEAVKFAREQANGVDVDQKHVGETLFTFLFG